MAAVSIHARKPRSYTEWRDLYQDRLYWLGSAAESYFQFKMLNAPDPLTERAVRSCVTRARQLARIQARMDACHDESWAQAMCEMVFDDRSQP